MKSKHITFLKPGCKKHTLGMVLFWGGGGSWFLQGEQNSACVDRGVKKF